MTIAVLINISDPPFAIKPSFATSSSPKKYSSIHPEINRKEKLPVHALKQKIYLNSYYLRLYTSIAGGFSFMCSLIIKCWMYTCYRHNNQAFYKMLAKCGYEIISTIQHGPFHTSRAAHTCVGRILLNRGSCVQPLYTYKHFILYKAASIHPLTRFVRFYKISDFLLSMQHIYIGGF